MGRDAWRWGIGSWLALRLIASAAASVSPTLFGAGETVPVPGYVPPDSIPAAAAWLRADALWYLKIADAGYGPEPGSYAFLPLFPLATRLVAPAFGGHELYAGLAVSNLAAALGLVAFYAMVNRLVGRDAARMATAGMALFPTAFFLVAPYGESLLLLFGAASLYSALKGNVAAALAAGFLAALTRPFGVLLAAPLFLIGWRADDRVLLSAAAGPLAGAGVWAAWVGTKLGDPVASVRVQSLWQRELGFPPLSLVRGAEAWATWGDTPFGPYFLFDLAAAIFGVVLVALSVMVMRRSGVSRPLWLGMAAYSSLVLLIPLAFPFPPRPLMSVPRFLLAAFPAFCAYAYIKWGLRFYFAAASALGLALAASVYVAARPLF